MSRIRLHNIVNNILLWDIDRAATNIERRNSNKYDVLLDFSIPWLKTPIVISAKFFPGNFAYIFVDFSLQEIFESLSLRFLHAKLSIAIRNIIRLSSHIQIVAFHYS